MLTQGGASAAYGELRSIAHGPASRFGGAMLTNEQFAEQIGITRQAVGAYETGVASPRDEVFSRIIAIARQPPAFFTTPRKRNAERFRMPNWRSLAAAYRARDRSKR
jgi:transcriptional regulator with XRE-family HTH domain